MDALIGRFEFLAQGQSANPLLSCLVIFIVFFVLATVTKWVIDRIATHGTSRTKNTLDDQLLAILGKPIYHSILLIGFAIASYRLPFLNDSRGIIIALLESLGIILWFFAALKVSKVILRSASLRPEKVKVIEPRTLPLFENLFVVISFAIAAYCAFIVWEINVSAWVASAGIMGLALSFAAKDSLANLFAGVFILADAPYQIGDFVVLDTGERGCVTQIGIRSTRLLTRDDVEITIPNSIMGNTKIINETAGPHPKYRIRVAVGAAYGTDVAAVRSILMDIAKESEVVCEDPEPRVRFRRFGESSLDFELLCWVEEPVLRGRVIDALNTAVYDRFNNEGIEFPYPKRDVYIKSMPAPSASE